jgi:hypothetical protein
MSLVITTGFNIVPELPRVQISSAGEDQTILCGVSTIFLEATVGPPENLPGHVFLWEQIEGSSVTLSSINTFTTSYPFTETSDKIFRFWVDKGAAEEQFQDVAVFHTPTSFTTFSKTSTARSFDNRLSASGVVCDDITASVIAQPGQPSTSEGKETNLQTSMVVQWSHPGDAAFDQYIVYYTVLENGTPVAQIPSMLPTNIGDPVGPPTDTLEYDNANFTDYSINTFYNVNGKELSIESCSKDFSNILIPDVQAYNSTSTFSTGNQTSFDSVKFSFLTNAYSSTGIFSSQNQNNINIIKFSFETQELTDNFFSSYDVEQRTFEISRTDQQGIGS